MFALMLFFCCPF